VRGDLQPFRVVGQRRTLRMSWDGRTTMFRDRRDAGRRLAARLQRFERRRPVVLGLARGGVPVADEVARRLDAPLDVLVVRKLGCPWQPELGVGAIGEGGIQVLNHELLAELRLRPEDLGSVVAREEAELDRRVLRYRGGRAPVDLQDRTVIVVDDGIATGATTRAAIDVVRQRGASHVVIAVPVASPQAIRQLRPEADEVECLESPEAFLAVGQFYRDFAQISDAEVAAALDTASASPA
jgi:putative phosphoribosyl transferase